jgi:hypothetical protein
MVLIARLVRFQPLLINGRLSEAPNGAAPAFRSERKSRSRQANSRAWVGGDPDWPGCSRSTEADNPCLSSERNEVK